MRATAELQSGRVHRPNRGTLVSLDDYRPATLWKEWGRTALATALIVAAALALAHRFLPASTTVEAPVDVAALLERAD